MPPQAPNTLSASASSSSIPAAAKTSRICREGEGQGRTPVGQRQDGVAHLGMGARVVHAGDKEALERVRF